MFVQTSVRVMGADSSMEAVLEESQKICCASVSKGGHVGLLEAHSGWKMESHLSSFWTSDTLERGCVNQCLIPANKAARPV